MLLQIDCHKLFFCFIVIICPPLQAPNNSQVTPNSCKVSPEYGTTCLFSCRNGYRLHGAPVAFCLSNGRWSSSTTVICKGQFMILHV